MKKTCGVQLALYLVVAAAIWAIVYRRFPVGEAALFAAFIGGFVVWLGIAYLWGIPAKIGQMKLIQRARAGEPPRDGEKMAAIGRLVPHGSSLVSPITRTPAVAYKYEIRRSSGKTDALLYSGFALNLSTIQGPQGAVRLLAYPELKVKAQYLSSADARRNAEEYIKATKFREPGLSNLRQSWSEMMALYKDDDGNVRDDHRSTSGGEPTLDGARFVEWVVRPGDQVCVIGQYSAPRGAIVHDPRNPLQQVTIETGQPEVFAGRALRGAIGYVIAGVIILTMAAAALTAFLATVPLEASEQMAPEMRASWPEIRLERLIERRVRVPMRKKGMLDTSTVSIMLPHGSASGRVRTDSREVFVARSEASREDAITTIRLDGDAVILAIDSKNQPLRLRLLGADVPADAFPGALDLEIAENNDETAAGRLTFLSDRPDLPAAHVAFRTTVAR